MFEILTSHRYQKAAEQGETKAQYNLGLMYANGQGGTQDDTEAVRWYRKAAKQGEAKAQTVLGFMYDNGRGVTQDYTEAARWYRKAGCCVHAPRQDIERLPGRLNSRRPGWAGRRHRARRRPPGPIRAFARTRPRG